LNNIYDAANKLANEIRHSEEFIKYRDARKLVLANPDLKNKIEEFEKIRYDVQVLSMEKGASDSEKMKRLQEMYTILIENKDIKEAKEELERISQDDILRRKALNRTLEIADKLQLKKEAKEAREKGLSDGLVTGEKIGIEKEKKSVIKKLHELNIPIEQIAKVVELKEEEVKEILSSNKLLSNERIEKIIKQIKSRIEYVSKLKQAREIDIKME